MTQIIRTPIEDERLRAILIKNRDELQSILDAAEEFDRLHNERQMCLTEESIKAKRLLNEVYGHGEFHDVDPLSLTYVKRDEWIKHLFRMSGDMDKPEKIDTIVEEFETPKESMQIEEKVSCH